MLGQLRSRARFGLSLRLFFLASLPCACRAAPPAVLPPPPASVEVVRAKKETLDGWTPFPGTTQPLPNHQARITASVEGTVVSVLAAKEGESVEAGEIIVRLDDHVARENLAKAEAVPKELEAQHKQAENAIQVARDALRRLQQVRKGNDPSDTPLVSNAEIEQAQATLNSAEAQLQVTEAKQASSRADLKTLKHQLSLYTLRTPIAGWLGTVQVSPGQTIAVGTPVADVLDLQQIDVVCFVPPSRISLLAPDQPAHLVTAGTQRTTSSAPAGKVVYVGRQARPETGSFEVKVRFPNEQRKLPANTVADLLIRTTPPAERWVIPEAALMEDQEPPQVAVVPTFHTEQDQQVGNIRLLQAVIGVHNRQRHRIEILGLQDPANKGPVPAVSDCWFVTAGGHGLENGDEVRVMEKPSGAGK